MASRTVDGNTDTSCSHTDVRSNITEAWLRIDLGRVYSVKSVKLWNRGGINKYHLLFFLRSTVSSFKAIISLSLQIPSCNMFKV